MQPSDADLNVAIDWLACVARGHGKLPERLDRLARAFVASPSGDAARLSSALQALLQGIQYIVFNIPAHLAEEKRRHFVAVLKPLASRDDYAWTAVGSADAETQTCEVYLSEDGVSGSAVPPELLVEEWKHVWNEYATLTYELETERIFTWNQLLLHGCRQPEPLGLSWTSNEHAAEYYVHASTALLHALGIDINGGLAVGALNALLSALPARLDGWPDLPPEVVQRFSALRPLDRIDVQSTAAASIFHLLRSYARWGGGAFLSIPVVLATGDERTTSAVLSVCSDAPLSAEAVLRWRLVAESVLPVIASSELVTQFHARKIAEQEAVRQAEAWAHEVKNRTQPIIASLARAVAVDGDLESDTSRALHGALILNAVSYAVQRALGGKHPVEHLSPREALAILEPVLQYLLNYHAATSRDNLQWQPRWSVQECVDRLSVALKVSLRKPLAARAEKVLTHSKTVYVAALLRELVQNIRINGAVRGDRSIRIEYAFQNDARTGTISLTLDQHQRELSVTIHPELGRGVKHANALFGGGRMNVGYIETDPIVVTERSPKPWDGSAVLIRSRAVFTLRRDDGNAARQ